MSAWAEARKAAARLTRAGVEDAALEAEYLARESSGLTRAEYFAGRPLEREARARLEAAVERRVQREPAAYIAGHREFFGHAFAVGPAVLVPRPETELLVEAAIAAARPASTIVDVGTGSGCIAISAALACPAATVAAVEISGAALGVAAANARRLGAPVRFVRGHLLTAVRGADIVLANLPYIPSGEIASLEPEVRDWEPRLALDGGSDGLRLIRELVADCGTRVRPRLLALEVAAGQAPEVAALAASAGAQTTTHRDLAGVERMVCASWR